MTTGTEVNPPMPSIASGFSALMRRRAWSVPRRTAAIVRAFAATLPPVKGLASILASL